MQEAVAKQPFHCFKKIQTNFPFKCLQHVKNYINSSYNFKQTHTTYKNYVVLLFLIPTPVTFIGCVTVFKEALLGLGNDNCGTWQMQSEVLLHSHYGFASVTSFHMRILVIHF